MQRDKDKLKSMVNGYQVTQLLGTAVKLRLPELIGKQPVPCETIAREVGCSEDSLYRLLRALASHGVFVEGDCQTFASTTLSEMMTANSQSGVAAELMSITDFMYLVWGQLFESMRSSRTAFEHVFGVTNWEYRASNPDENARFNNRMAHFASGKGKRLAETYVFPEGTTLIDVGGGTGALLREVLSRHPTLSGIVFDQPHVVKSEGREWPENLSRRCEFAAGNFFESVPGGGDFYILSGVLHDWSDADSGRILRNCHAAMPPHSKLLILDGVVPSDNKPHFSKMMDLYMFLTNVGGRHRTLPEWAALLKPARFELEGTRPLGGLSCIEAHPS